MHKNEKVNFLFPSHMGFGYHGDNKRIGTNEPLICTVTLHDFIPEDSYKKQLKAKENPAVPAVEKEVTDSSEQTTAPIKKIIATPAKPNDTLKQ
jgi:hypothetical protein